MGNKRTAALFLAFIMIVSVLSGCGPTNSIDPGTSQAPGENSGGVKKDSLNIGIGSEFSSITPLMFNTSTANRDGMTIFAMYDPLLWFDTETGTLSPWLAKEITQSDDGLEYTIILRDDVYFHNGEQMTSADVAFTLDQCSVNPVITKQNFSGFSHAEIVDEFTVKCVMEQPFAAAMNFFASYHFGVLCKSYFDEMGEEGYRDHPIGTGPYKFADRVIGGSLTLEANENYWGEKAGIKNVTISIMPDASAQLLALETGEVDVLYNPTIESMTRLEGNPNVKWDYCDSFLTASLGFASECKPFGENFRKAILSAIDYDAINNIVNLGYTKRANCTCPEGVTARPADGTFTEPLSYDVEAAKAYLADSDYTDGSEFTIICISGSKEEVICKIVQSQLQTIGINAVVSSLDGGTFKTFLNQGDYGLSILSSLPSLYDMNLLYQTFDPTIEARFNAMPGDEKYELSDLAMQTLTELDEEARTKLFAEMTSMVNEHAILGYLYYDVNTIAFSASLSEIRAIPGTNYRIADWYWG